MSAMLQDFDDVSKTAPEPIYQQIKAIIRQRIASGEWPAGQKLPSENDLVVALDVSRMTINRAIRELTSEGYLSRLTGVGTFVREMPRQTSMIEIMNIAEEIAARGHDRKLVERVEHLLYLAEYKRRQAAPGVKLTLKNFGRDRRYPITNKFRDR